MGKNKKGFGRFLAGAAVGVGLGLLFAPQEGSKTRKQLKKKIDELMEQVKNIDPEEVKQNIEDKIAEIKADLQDLDGEKILEIAKDKASKIAKKCDELVKLAVKKGTPVVQKAVEGVRVKTIEVLEETIDKLEKAEVKVNETAKEVKKDVKQTAKKATKATSKKPTSKATAKK